jgi:hypothetical protein
MADYLAIYLNDHLAGATLGLELAKRAAGEHAGTPLGDFLAGLRDEIAADRRALEEIMDAAGVGEDRLKVVAFWAAEKAGRLKLNGHWLSRSPLSPMVELEGLATGITGKLLLWRALAATPGVSTAGHSLDELIARAEAQLAAVEEHRIAVASTALARR